MLTIAGIGNEYRSDDAIGLRLVEALREQGEYPGVITELWGDPDLLTITNYMLNTLTPLLIADCMQLGKRPGSFIYYPSGTYHLKNRESSVTNHGSSFNEAMLLAESQGFNQPVHLFGVQPFSLELSNNLSIEMKKQFKVILNEFLEVIAGITK